MVQHQRCLVIARVTAVLTALIGLGGCCHITEQAEMAGICSFKAGEAKAWVNRMPGPPRAERKMQVYVEIEPDDTARMLVRLDDKYNRLQLDVREWEDGKSLPHIGWSMSAPANMPAGVDIYCDGEMILSIDDIKTVF